MNTIEILEMLDGEIGRLERARALLSDGEPAKRRGRPKGSTNKQTSPAKIAAKPRQTMSASARKLIAAAQRARWAKQKGTAALNKAAPAKKITAKQPAKTEKRLASAKPAKSSSKKTSVNPQTAAGAAATA